MNQEIMDRIQRLRLQLLVHSRVYYELNETIVSDRQWDAWARELVELQAANPKESGAVVWYEAFKDWDGTTGAFLPLNDTWVVRKVTQLYGLGGKKEGQKKVKKVRRKLF